MFTKQKKKTHACHSWHNGIGRHIFWLNVIITQNEKPFTFIEVMVSLHEKVLKEEPKQLSVPTLETFCVYYTSEGQFAHVHKAPYLQQNFKLEQFLNTD